MPFYMPPKGGYQHLCFVLRADALVVFWERLLLILCASQPLVDILYALFATAELQGAIMRALLRDSDRWGITFYAFFRGQ